MAKVTLTGILTWEGTERRTDRYGLITLDRTNYNDTASVAVAVDDPVAFSNLTDTRARIRARVLETRGSGHIGDLFRGLFPSTPEVGAEFDLGEGTLRFADCAWSGLGVQFGLEPDDGRPNNWFDPTILYQLHDQTVEIIVEDV